jgi:hypothetical protein
MVLSGEAIDSVVPARADLPQANPSTASSMLCLSVLQLAV